MNCHSMISQTGELSQIPLGIKGPFLDSGPYLTEMFLIFLSSELGFIIAHSILI